MKTRIRGWEPAKVMLVIYFLTGMMLLTGPVLDNAAAADLTLKISHLEKALDLIDSMGMSDTGQLPTAAVRGMLQGVGWIDSERSIVLSWDTSGDHPYSAILVPYQRANPDFKAAYRALSRRDYYLLTLPPGEAATIPESIEKEMAGASRDLSDATLSLILELRQLISANQLGIDKMLESVDQVTSQGEMDPLAPAAEDVRQMLVGLVDFARQIDLFSFSLDLSESQLKMMSETVPAKGSKLSAFFTTSGMTTRLDAYRPVHDITFRSRSCDVDAALDMLNTIFGSFYRKMGISFVELMTKAGNFTGETAGGMTYGKGNRVLVESMAVLKNDVDAETFLETVYMPWAEAYGRSVTRLMENETGRPIDSMLIRMSDSTVGGHRVTGIKMKLPVSPMSFGDSRQGGEDSVMTYAVRTAVVGNLMLMAPDDERLAEMIRIAGNLRKKTSHGPMITMELDVGKYLSSLARFIPGHGIDPASVPDIGTVAFVAVAGSDRVISSIAMETDDIRMMMAYLNRIQPGEGGRAPAELPAAAPQAAQSEKKSVSPVVRDAGYWMEQGRLAATYGAYTTAIGHYKKALSLGIEESRVLFNMGIAYGELGEYPKALDHLNRAIQASPEKGAYYYARARVYLLSGDKDMAMADFKDAAERGDLDARQYLEGAGE